MDEMQAIRERHSVRTYQDKKLTAEDEAKLRKVIEDVNRESGLEFELAPDAGKTFTKLLNRALGLGSAPAVIACMGKDCDELDEKIGYWGEKIVLSAQMMELNTCWAGTFSREKIPVTVKEGNRLAIVIAVGYGANSGRVRKSKEAGQVSNCVETSPEWFKRGVEAALLAPTAVNQQKFEILLSDDGTVSFTDKGGILSKIDLGIIRYNFEVGATSKD